MHRPGQVIPGSWEKRHEGKDLVLLYCRCIDSDFTPYAPLVTVNDQVAAREPGVAYFPKLLANEYPILCPECLSENVLYHAASTLYSKRDKAEYAIVDSALYCKDCHALWKVSNARCLACGYHIEYINNTQLKCSRCGQVWDEDLVKHCYEVGDELPFRESFQEWLSESPKQSVRTGEDSSLKEGS